jgi:hypothetical protein
MKTGVQAQTPRAERFPFQIPLHYRQANLEDWHECKTVNISRTGILFQTDQTIASNSLLDIRVQFPASMTLSCQGSVVRTTDSACAVRIHHYRISPAS